MSSSYIDDLAFVDFRHRSTACPSYIKKPLWFKMVLADIFFQKISKVNLCFPEN